MKKVKMSNCEDIGTMVKNALFVLVLFFAFALNVQKAEAQVVQGPPPEWMTPAEANAIINFEISELQADLNILPPGPAANAISEVMQLYDLIQQNIIQLNKVGDAVYEAFGMQYGQVPVVYANGSTASLDSDAGSIVSYTPQLIDAYMPRINAPNYGNILSLYNEVSDRLSY